MNKTKIPMVPFGTVVAEGRTCILVPVEEWSGAVQAVSYAEASIGKDLASARTVARLTQGQLAGRLHVSQSFVSQAESGQAKVGEDYILRVLEACGLPEDWTAPTSKVAETASPFEPRHVVIEVMQDSGGVLRLRAPKDVVLEMKGVGGTISYTAPRSIRGSGVMVAKSAVSKTVGTKKALARRSTK